MDIKKLVQRADKVAYLEVKDKYNKMDGFTGFTTNKNPKEYTRQYVHDYFETTDVVGMSNSIDFAFDQYKGDPVHELLVEIIDNEKLGSDAIVSIMVVDFTAEPEGGAYPAKRRNYSVIPNTEGGSTDAYTYEGTFKVVETIEFGTATSDDEFKTATFAKKTIVNPEG